MKYLILLITLVFAINPMLAQTKNNRVEVSIEEADKFKIIPMGENGVLLATMNRERDFQEVTFTMYSAAFKEQWSKILKIDKSLSVINMKKVDNFSAVFLFTEFKGQLSEMGQEIMGGPFAMIEIDVETGDMLKNQGAFPLNTTLDGMTISSDKLFLHGTTVPTSGQSCLQSLFNFTCIPLLFGTSTFKFQPAATAIDLNNGKAKLIRNNFKGHAIYAGFNADTVSNGAVGIVRNRVRNGTIRSFKTTIDETGKVVDKFTLGTDPKRPILQAHWIPINEQKSIAIGTYSATPKAGILFSGMRLSDEIGLTRSNTEGVFLSVYEDDSEMFSEYYPFKEIEAIKDIIDPKGRKRRKKKELKDLEMSFLPHKPVRTADGYIISGELYQAEYRTEYFTDANGRTTSRTYFDGFRFMHALVLGISNDGELLWNQSFELGGKSFILEPKVSLRANDDEVTLLYSYAGMVYSKKISDGEVVNESDGERVASKFSDDKIKSASGSESAYWYDDYFLAYGFQKIKSNTAKAKGEKKRRRVFYFNKLELEN